MGAGGIAEAGGERGTGTRVGVTSLGLTGSSAAGPGADGQAAVSTYTAVGPPWPRRGVGLAGLAGLASLPCEV